MMTKKLNFVTFAISPVLIKFYFLESRTRLPLTETVVIVLYSFNRDWKRHPNLNKIPSLPCLQIPTGHNESFYDQRNLWVYSVRFITWTQDAVTSFYFLSTLSTSPLPTGPRSAAAAARKSPRYLTWVTWLAERVKNSKQERKEGSTVWDNRSCVNLTDFSFLKDYPSRGRNPATKEHMC